MTSLKAISSLFIIIFTLTSQAQKGGGGGGGGGVVTPEARISNAQIEQLRQKHFEGLLKPKEIILNIEEKEDSFHFAYGQANQNNWNIQKLEIKKTDLAIDEAVIKALEESMKKGDWVEIK